jgi:hypothetical protein
MRKNKNKKNRSKRTNNKKTKRIPTVNVRSAGPSTTTAGPDAFSCYTSDIENAKSYALYLRGKAEFFELLNHRLLSPHLDAILFGITDNRFDKTDPLTLYDVCTKEDGCLMKQTLVTYEQFSELSDLMQDTLARVTIDRLGSYLEHAKENENREVITSCVAVLWFLKEEGLVEHHESPDVLGTSKAQEQASEVLTEVNNFSEEMGFHTFPGTEVADA